MELMSFPDVFEARFETESLQSLSEGVEKGKHPVDGRKEFWCNKLVMLILQCIVHTLAHSLPLASPHCAKTSWNLGSNWAVWWKLMESSSLNFYRWIKEKSRNIKQRDRKIFFASQFLHLINHFLSVVVSFVLESWWFCLPSWSECIGTRMEVEIHHHFHRPWGKLDYALNIQQIIAEEQEQQAKLTRAISMLNQAAKQVDTEEGWARITFYPS